MLNRAPFVFIATTLASAAIAAQTASQKPREEPQRPTFRTEANFVRVDIYPTLNGSPVTDLTAADFAVFEDGKRQKIETFEFVQVRGSVPQDPRVEPNTIQQSRDAMRDPRARVFVLFLDVPHVTTHGSWNIREPLIRLIDRVLAPDDLIGIMTPRMSARDVVFARKTQVVAGGLRDIWPWGERFTLARDDRERLWEACFTWPEHQPVLDAMRARKRERDALDALRELVNTLRYEREERKAIITISEGWALYRPDERITTPVKDPLGNAEPIPGPPPIGVGPDGRLRMGADTSRGNVSKSDCDADRLALAQVDHDRLFKDIIDEANRANASFYTVDPRGLPAVDSPIGPEPPPPLDVDQQMLRHRLDTLRTLAANTDGLAVLNNNDLDKGLRRISDDLTSYYLIGYYTSNPALDGRFRRIEVKVNQPGVHVRARRGYRAPTRAEISKATSAAPVPSSVTSTRNILDGLSRVRSGAAFRASAVARSGQSPTIWVAGELAKPATGATAADIIVVNGSESVTTKAAIGIGQRSFVVAVPLKSSPSAPVDVRVRVLAEGPEGNYSDSVRVEAVEGLPQPLLFRRGPSTGNRIEAAADPVFSRTERVRLDVPADAAGTLSSGRVLDRNGTALDLPVTLAERTDATSGQRWLTAEITLAALGAGDYIVELSGTAGGAEQKVVTAIRVTR